MISLRILVLLLLNQLLFQEAFSQEKLSQEALKEDLDLLRNIVIGTSSKLEKKDIATIDSIIAIKKNQLSDSSLTAVSFLNFITDLCIKTKFDEHASTSLNKDSLKMLISGEVLFPLPVKIIDTFLVVNSDSTVIPYGSIIHSINGETALSILMDWTDGCTNSFLKRRFERTFSLTYLLKKGKNKQYDITYSVPAHPNKILQQTLAGINTETFNRYNRVYPLHKDALKNGLNTKYYAAQQTYLIQLNAFTLKGKAANSKKFNRVFRKVFRQISKTDAKKLIIDLRYNGGGNVRFPAILYSYIAKETFVEDVHLSMPDFDLPHKHLIEKISRDSVTKEKEVDKLIKKISKHFDKNEDGQYSWNFIKKHQYKPQKYNFDQSVSLLIGGNTCSASSYFSALFKSNNRGTIIGTTIGCSHHAITGGKTLTYVLPNSKIQVTIPIMTVNFSKDLYAAVPEKKIIPNKTLSSEKKYQYFLDRKDFELEHILSTSN